jgi:hypothetical protein
LATCGISWNLPSSFSESNFPAVNRIDVFLSFGFSFVIQSAEKQQTKEKLEKPSKNQHKLKGIVVKQLGLINERIENRKT